MEAKEVLLALRTKRGFPKKSWPKGSLSPARRCLDGRWGRPFPGRKPSSAFPPCMTFPSIRFWARPEGLSANAAACPWRTMAFSAGSQTAPLMRTTASGAIQGKFVYSSLEELIEVLGRYHGHRGAASRTGAGLFAGPASRSGALEGKIEKKGRRKNFPAPVK